MTFIKSKYLFSQRFNEFEIIGKKHPIRRYSQILMDHIYFQRISLLAIIANSIIIAIADYSHVDSSGNLVTQGSIRNRICVESDIFFTLFFLVECLIKVTALGFLGDPPAYLSDYWNWLDFVVVIAGYIYYTSLSTSCNGLNSILLLWHRIVSLFPNMPNVKIIRTFRVLRPLKSLSKYPGMALLLFCFS